MSTNELSGQESGESTDEQRARNEEFSMVVVGGDGGGHINVRNDSHDDPNDHIHTVHVANGEADGCTCPHALYRDAHCKHQRAVEHRPLVLSSASAASASASPATTGQQVATDGGAVVETHAHEDEDDDTDEDDTDEETDHWGQSVEHYDDGPVGAGEARQCQACGSRFEVALVAATAENSYQWEEFYRCQNCNAGGSFRVDETQPTREAQRTWTGMMAYPDE
jgi:hypothetical protein